MKKIILTIIILMIVLALINILPGLKKGLGNFVLKIFLPIVKLSSKIGQGIAGLVNILANISDLNKTNIDLGQKNLALQAEIAKLKEVERENDILRETLNISSPDEPIQEVASIVGKDVQGIQDWILLNRGTRHGIKKNRAVISPQGALVGRIVEVQDDFSKVMLITNKKSLVAALVAETRSEGLIKKNANSGLIMDLIPKTENLEIGQTVITSGMDNIFPRGILIGKIESIETPENQIFQKIIISPAIDFNKLETVVILK
jgi:rod shape-determining protein MreC